MLSIKQKRTGIYRVQGYLSLLGFSPPWIINLRHRMRGLSQQH